MSAYQDPLLPFQYRNVAEITKLRALQWRRFKQLLRTVLSSNRFYRNKYKKAGITSADDVRNWNDYKDLPYVTKQELTLDQREHPPLGTNLTVPLRHYTFLKTTSGTSGNPLTVPYSDRDLMAAGEDAVGIFLKNDPRFPPGTRVMLLHPPGAYTYAAENPRRNGLVVIPPDARSDAELLKRIIDMKIEIINAYFSRIVSLTQTAQSLGLDMKKRSRVRILMGGGEYVNPNIRKWVSAFWGAKYYLVTVSTELRSFGMDCANASSPHLIEKPCLMEIVDPATGISSPKGELIATPLWRLDFPLIRYRTGDYVEMMAKQCQCDNIYPRIRNGVLGRIDGSLRIRAVSYYPAELLDPISHFPDATRYQFVVTKERGLDQVGILLELPLKSARKDSLASIRRAYTNFLGFQPKVQLVPPNTFPFEPGKRRYIFDLRPMNNQLKPLSPSWLLVTSYALKYDIMKLLFKYLFFFSRHAKT